MGGGGSQTVNQNINMKALTSITNSSMNKIQETNENRLTNVQSLDVKLYDIVNCPISMEQTIESKFVATTESMIQAVQASQTELTNELKAQASAALDKSTQAGNFQFVTNQMRTSILIKKLKVSYRIN